MCGLDSLSIFFRNRAEGAEGLTYLHHNGVSQEAQHAYRTGVFEEDPFVSVIGADDRTGRLIWWEDTRLAQAAGRAAGYRDFINCHEVDVVGAWVQQIFPDFFLVIGAHCRPGGHSKGNVARRQFQHDIRALSQVVISELLEMALMRIGGPAMLDPVLPPRRSDGCNAAIDRLSAREVEIARLVGIGRLNKEIAHLVGISEFTVENHLRKVYRKLGVHNRAAMTAMLFGGLTCQ
jgi:DNA-binding CsgD family transcriptional regulator